jgi:(+)-trans-carveol dehydrogenase
MIDIALNGAWRTARAAIPTMIERGVGGSIVFTSSAMGLKPAPGLAHYVAAKHGVVGLAKTLAVELAEHSIRVNTVNPGTTTSPLTFNDAAARAFVPDKEEPTFDDLADLYGELTLLPIKTLEPIDVANAVVWLCTDEARYITGIALPVDAGSLIK